MTQPLSLVKAESLDSLFTLTINRAYGLVLLIVINLRVEVSVDLFLGAFDIRINTH